MSFPTQLTDVTKHKWLQNWHLDTWTGYLNIKVNLITVAERERVKKKKKYVLHDVLVASAIIFWFNKIHDSYLAEKPLFTSVRLHAV